MKVGFIGAGNMGGAIAKAVLGVLSGSDVLVCDTDESKASAVGGTVADAHRIASECDYIVTAVKPQVLRSALSEIKDELSARSQKPVIVTPAAGIKIADVDEMAGGGFPIIRIMPNTPVSVGLGMIQYVCNADVTQSMLDGFIGFMSKAGMLDRTDEGKIDAASAVSGCGPAFMYMFAEALADAGVECGLPRDKAIIYALQMIRGSSELALRSGKPLSVLKDEVCSPGGTTIRGVHALEKGGMRGAVMDAVKAAFEYNAQLGKK